MTFGEIIGTVNCFTAVPEPNSINAVRTTLIYSKLVPDKGKTTSSLTIGTYGSVLITEYPIVPRPEIVRLVSVITGLSV